MTYVRMFADDEGESYLEDIEVEFAEIDYAPPTPPLEFSDSMESSGLAFMRLSPGWKGEIWHPTPRRQMAVVVSDRVEAVVSDGERRVLEPGDALVMEDTHGKGHTGIVQDDQPVTFAVTQLGD